MTGLKTFFSIIIIISFQFLCADLSKAIMKLIPPIQEIEAPRGRIANFRLTIVNDADEESPGRFSIHDMDITIDGIPFIADSGAVRGCGSWIELEPREHVFKPHESIVLNGRINVPRDAEGGYYACIKGSFIDVSIPLSGEQVNLRESQIGLESQALVVLLVTVPSSRNRPVIVPETLYVYPRGEKGESPVITDFGSQDGWEIMMPVRNDGNIHTKVSGVASIYSEAGIRLGGAPLRAGKGYVLPGRVRNLKAAGDGILSDGYYMLRIALQTEKRRTMANSFAFAVYEGEVYPGALNDEIAELIRLSSPGFALREPFTEKKITPGGTTYLPVMLINTINDTLKLIPKKMEWNLTPAGQPVLGDDNSVQKRSCTSWIEPADSVLVLPPGRRYPFKLKIDCPEDISGEYYSAVSFFEDKVRTDFPGEFLASRTQLIALSTPRDIEYGVEVDSIRIKREVDPRLTLHRFQFNVRNTGNAHCFASGAMSFEKEIAAGVFKPYGKRQEFGDYQTYLLPGNRMAFEVDVPNMESGYYRIILAVTYEREQQPVVHYQNFTVK
jgi:hypothetical protein